MKRMTVFRVWGAAAAALVMATLGRADGLRNPPASVSGIGHIGGKIAQTEDATAVSLNPAAIAGATNLEVEAGVVAGYATREFSSVTGAHIESEDPWGLLPYLYAVWPLRPELTAGLGLNVPFGRASSFPEDNDLSTLTPYSTRLFTLDANPVLAWKVNDRLSVALGLSALWSELEFKQKVPWSMVTGMPLPNGDLELSGDGIGFGANAALRWRIADGHRIGITYRSSSTVDYEGDFKLGGIPPGAPFQPTSDLETEITFPSVLAAGYAVDLTKTFTLEADVEWIDHSTFDTLSIDAGANTAILPSPDIPQNYDDTWTFGLGATWRFQPRWEARAGYLYLPAPTPDETMIPSASEEDQGVLSVGLGYDNGVDRIQVAYAYGLFDGRTVNDNLNPAFNGNYEHESHLVGLSYGRRF